MVLLVPGGDYPTNCAMRHGSADPMSVSNSGTTGPCSRPTRPRLCPSCPPKFLEQPNGIEIIYSEAARTGKPVFCIVDDTIASKTKPSSQALYPIEDAYFHQSHLKGKQDVYKRQVQDKRSSPSNVILPSVTLPPPARLSLIHIQYLSRIINC